MDGIPDLPTRTKAFALRIIKLHCALPKNSVCHVVGTQMLRSGTSVGAHLREGRRSRSDAELVSKLEGALQELDETAYWMELLVESGIMKRELLANLMKEADEITAIMVASVKTIKRRKATS